MNTSPAWKQDRFWNQIMGVISRGSVVPVIGEELLLMPQGEGGRTLYEALALRFASSAGIELEAEQVGNLSSTIRNHPEFRDNPHDVYQDLAYEIDQWNPPIPEPLRALARIRHFNFFVSTTFDNLLERALNEVRFDGKEKTEVIVYSPKNVPDDRLVGAKMTGGHPVVFQMFGNYKTPLQFALTEGDMVEYMHALQTVDYQPKRIFSELFERPLLLLGTNFPNWLTRMFLRMARKTPLDNREVPKQYLAAEQFSADQCLQFFLRNFTANTELVDGETATEFVNEIEAKWTERFGTTSAQITPVDPAAIRPMPRNAVFISYCASDTDGSPARDRQIAIRIRDALEAKGVDVWLDVDQLEGGDEFARKIQRYIQTCSLFIPLISTVSESRTDGFFRREWFWALDKLPDFTGSDRQFILPVALDDIQFYDARIPDAFKSMHCMALHEGVPDETFVNRVLSLYGTAQTEHA